MAKNTNEDSAPAQWEEGAGTGGRDSRQTRKPINQTAGDKLIKPNNQDAWRSGCRCAGQKTHRSHSDRHTTLLFVIIIVSATNGDVIETANDSEAVEKYTGSCVDASRKLPAAKDAVACGDPQHPRRCWCDRRRFPSSRYGFRRGPTGFA